VSWEIPNSPGFEKTKEEPSDVKNPKVDRGRHESCRGTPEYNEDSHERSRRYSDDEVGGKGLPGELGNGVNGSGETRISRACVATKEASPELVAGQGYILTQSIYVSKSKDRLVEYLVEVDPA